MQRLWLISTYLQQQWNCDSRHALHVDNTHFAKVAGLKKLQQTQRDQVIDLVTEGWLEVVPETEGQRIKFFRLTVTAEEKLAKLLKLNHRNAVKMPRSIEKMGIQPKLMDVSGGDLSNTSISGEFDPTTPEETFDAFWQTTL